MHVSASLLAISLLTALPALAQATPPEAGPPDSVTIAGLGGGAVREPYRGMKTRTRVLPLLIYENRWVSVALPTVDVKLGHTGPVSWRLRTRFGFDGYQAKDSAFAKPRFNAALIQPA